MSKLFSLPGSECISYLLTYVASGSWELKSPVSVISNSGFALADLPSPKGEEPESGSDTQYRKGGKKPSGRISAEKAEKMTVSQEKREGSRYV
ncbi:LOW QUALITY PROTEIN: uncharacterized protein FYW23_011743 [Sylvia borin]